MKLYSAVFILNRIWSIGMMRENEKMLSIADNMFSTTEPAR